MLYGAYMHEAMKVAIVNDEEATGFSYLDPNYRVLLEDAGQTPDQIEDRNIDWAQVAEVMTLEVERRNKLSDKSRFVIDWLFEIISSTIEPTMLQEENELMKNMMDYMKLNHELKDKEQTLQDREKALDHREEIQETRGNVLQLVPGMNFSKRGTK